MAYDKKHNQSIAYMFSTDKKQMTETQWKNISVGSIIRIDNDNPVPADVLIIKSQNEDGFSYMQTSNLDGETNLKPRNAVLIFQKIINKEEDLNIQGDIEVSLPNKEFTNIEGKLCIKDESFYFNYKNCLLRGSVLKNTKYVYGIVLYSGKDTKIMMNIDNCIEKLSLLDVLLNKIIIFMVIFCIILTIINFSIGISFLRKDGSDDNQYMDYALHNSSDNKFLEGIKLFVSFLYQSTNLFTISIIVTLEAVKLLQLIRLSYDKNYQKENEMAKFFSLKLHENLGEVKYIFSDKTGTLTKNEMEFQNCFIYDKVYGELPKHSTLGITLSNSENEELSKTFNKRNIAKNFDLYKLEMDCCKNEPIDEEFNQYFKGFKDVVKEFFLNMAINHDVFRSIEKSDKSLNDYTGTSPDEIVLVGVAKDVGIEYIKKEGDIITIKNEDVLENYKILKKFDYTSTSKKSSIIVKHMNTNIIKLYIKGADDVIFNSINSDSQKIIKFKAEMAVNQFADMGLRTLCYSMKILSEEEFNKFNTDYNNAYDLYRADSSNTEYLKILANLESDTILVGVSALNDLLQDGVKSCIRDFIEADINVWMITGDKLNTAESIGFSCGLLNTDTEIFRIKEANSNNVRNNLLNIINYIKEAKTILDEDLNENDDQKEENKSEPKENFINKLHRMRSLEIKTPSVGLNDNSNNNINYIKKNSAGTKKNSLRFSMELNRKFPAANLNQNENKNNNDNKQKDLLYHSTKQRNQILAESILNREGVFDDSIRNNVNNNSIIERVQGIKEEYYNSVMDENESINNFPEAINENNNGGINESKINENNINVNNNESGINLLKHSTPSPVKLSYSMIIDGSSLNYCLNENADLFYECLLTSRSIICARCNPEQKSKIVEFIKSRTNDITLAIGDGGNDINMIRTAHIGIGIFGKEGCQAGYSADYAFSQFKYLRNLLFYFGRFSAIRNSYYIHYNFFKNTLLHFIDALYTYHCYISGTIFFDEYYITGYNSFIAVVPIVLFCVFQEDVDLVNLNKNDKQNILKLVPELYRNTREYSRFRFKLFLFYFFAAIILSIPIFYASIFGYGNDFINKDGNTGTLYDSSLCSYFSVIIVIYYLLYKDTTYINNIIFILNIIQLIVIVGFPFGVNYVLDSQQGHKLYDIIKYPIFYFSLFVGTFFDILVIASIRTYQTFIKHNIVSSINSGNCQKEIEIYQKKRKQKLLDKIKRILKLFKKLDKAKSPEEIDNAKKTMSHKLIKLHQDINNEINDTMTFKNISKNSNSNNNVKNDNKNNEILCLNNNMH